MDNLPCARPWCQLCLGSTGTLEDTPRTPHWQSWFTAELGESSTWCWGSVSPLPAPHILGHPREGQPLAHSRRGVFSVGTEAPAEPGQLPRGLAAIWEEEEEEEGT